jgi:guanylate kinase
MIILISGVQGVGKTTIINEILKECPNYKLSISATTRPMRHNEFSNEYEFLTLDEFQEKEKNGYFLEVVEFNNYKYGTPLHQFKSHIILNVNPSSIIDFQKLFKIHNFNYKSIFINAPFSIIKERLSIRDNNQNLEEKIIKAKKEIIYKDYFHYIVDNIFIEKALEEIIFIIKKSIT